VQVVLTNNTTLLKELNEAADPTLHSRIDPILQAADPILLTKIVKWAVTKTSHIELDETIISHRHYREMEQ
jgi:hypothetical protein